MVDFSAQYEKNRCAVNAYRWWRRDKLPEWENLSAKAIQIDTDVFTYDMRGDGIAIARNDRVWPRFFRDLSQPLLVRNEYNSYLWEYLVDNVRESSDFGGDNHIYFYYDSFDDFCLLLQVIDIRPYLSSEKIIFLFGEKELEECYPINFLDDYGIDYSSVPARPVQVREVQRLVVNWVSGVCNGNLLMAEALDNHKNFLTIREFGLVGFSYLYDAVFAGHTVSEAKELIFNATDRVVEREWEYLFCPISIGGKCRVCVPKHTEFWQILASLFSGDEHPTKAQWFIGIFLAYNMGLGRDLNQRIAPSVVFETHAFSVVQNMGKNYDFFRSFKYFRGISLIRRPTIALGSTFENSCNIFDVFDTGFPHYLDQIRQMLSLSWRGKSAAECYLTPFYLPGDDEFLKDRCIVRFEDLKLYPKATLMAICEFIDVEWDDAMLQLTENGTIVGTMISNKTVKGFDPAPVYNQHERMLSPFDYYRIELVIGDDYRPWGYSPLYHKDGMSYTKEEIKKLFQVQFKCEQFHYTAEQTKKAGSLREGLAMVASERMGQCVDVTRDKKTLVPIPWLKPKEEWLDGELYG